MTEPPPAPGKRTAADYLAGGRVLLRSAAFAVVRASGPRPDAFAVIRDPAETTWVIEESRLGDVAAELTVEPGWRLLTFDAAMPFDLVGFLAEVSRALAARGVGIFVLSSYSTDHVLVKGRDLEAALAALRDLGLRVVPDDGPGGDR